MANFIIELSGVIRIIILDKYWVNIGKILDIYVVEEYNDGDSGD
ncbi:MULTISPECIES: hypothetical protein [Streptococcus]|nr:MULTISPECIES: hypothetical protein [Streptococcus]